MSTKFTRVTLLFLFLGGFTALISFSGLFWVEARAAVNDAKSIHFRQNGYTGGLHHGKYRGSTTSVRILYFSFNVDGKAYEGWGLPNEYDGKTTKIKFFNHYPLVNISSSQPWFFLSLFLFFCAFSSRTLVMWARGILHKNG